MTGEMFERDRDVVDPHLVGVRERPPERFVRGEGALLFDEAGREYLDFLGGVAASALGHAHPRLTAALRDQVGQLLHTSNLVRHRYAEEVAARLVRMSGLAAVFFTNSGSEAVDAAMKIARKYHEVDGHGQRDAFVALRNAFHGRTMGALSVTWNEEYRAAYEPLIPGVTFVDPGDTAALEAALEKRPAALILEPIQGEGGIRELSGEFLRAARELCDASGTVLIHDEVQTGAGRTGTFLCADHHGVKPDLVTLAKPVAGGLPMGAVLVGDRLADAFGASDNVSTFAGGPLACRASLVVLEELESGLLENVAARGAELQRGLDELMGDFSVITERRGRGLMQGIQLAHGAKALTDDVFAHGLIVNCTAGDVVRFLPPYVVTGQQIGRGLAILRDGLIRLGAGA